MDSLTLRFYFHRGQEISKLCVRSRKTQCLLKKQAKNLTNHSCMEIGISTFLETTPDPRTGKVISHGERLRHAVERIVLAYEVGPDVYGVKEHHRADYTSSAPAIVLAAAAIQTKRLSLTSAVSVLSSDDPMRAYQDFATLDALFGRVVRLRNLFRCFVIVSTIVLTSKKGSMYVKRCGVES